MEFQSTYYLPNFFQFSSSTEWLVILLTILIVLVLLGIGYWIFAQLFSLADFPLSPKKQHTRQPSSSPTKTEKQEKNIPTPSVVGKPDPLAWVKEEFPDALLMDAQTIVREYQAGRRNFQSAYPTAVAPYDTYLKWTVLDEIDLSRAMLYRAPFDGTSLLDANFSGAYLEGVSFRGAILRRANLNWADLSGADLSGADLTGADLSYASLQGVDLSKAKLNGAIVTSEQLETARSLKDAILPDGSKSE